MLIHYTKWPYTLELFKISSNTDQQINKSTLCLDIRDYIFNYLVFVFLKAGTGIAELIALEITKKVLSTFHLLLLLF